MDVRQFLERAFPDHSIGEKLREDAEGTLFRGRRLADGRAVLFVTSGAEHPTSEWLVRLEREYALREDLELPWAARPLALVSPEGRAVLLREDPGGWPLDAFPSRRFKVGESLRIALGVAVCLSRLHAEGLVHKDIKPANILADPSTGAVALTGFGIAASSPRERQEPEPTEPLTGTLAYMAPEQTGRMNRPLDARSDLYSLGVVLYEALTGRLPFTAANASELLHSHLARQAVPPVEVEPAIPMLVSDLVMKLLAKPPEERYQTALGLEADLRRGLAEWEAHARIQAFPLAQEDIPDRPLPLQKLYGREAEEAMLRAAWARVASGAASEVVLVAGPPGVGKSALVNALRRDVEKAHGLFAAGKFDEQKKNIPYASLVQAFHQLIRKLLVRPEAEIARWRQVLEAAVHPNGRLLTDILPDLELLLGPQPEVPELAPLTARNRFLMAFSQFLDALATHEHPLVLFLDDLQWLDPATLELLEQLVSQPERRHLLLLAAYRDNDVGAAHPLRTTLDSIRRARVPMQDILLGPLVVEELVSLLADMLHCPPDQVAPLARLVREKTEGNPFFALQFLAALQEERLLWFAPRTGGWTFDPQRIHAKGYTDNVVDLLAGRIHRLSPACRETLQILACLGIRAETRVLLRVLGDTEELALAVGAPGGSTKAIHAPLREAERAGLLVRRDNSHAFVHDRIREAAYASIAVSARPAEHLRIAHLLLAERTVEEVGDDEVFELANQFNRGINLLANADERDLVRRLNLRAGRKSRAAIAYAATREYLSQASALLPTDPWTTDYAEAFATRLELAECEYLLGHFEQAKLLFSEIIAKARNDLDRANALCLRVRLYDTSGRLRDALEAGIEALRLLGFAIPDAESDIREAAEAEKAQIPALLAGRRIADLAQAAEVSDPRVRASLDLISDTVSTAYLLKPALYPLFALRGLTLSLRHGNTAASCFIYVAYALLLVAADDLPSALAFSDMAMALDERYRNVIRKEGALLCYRGGFVSPWAHPLLDCLATLEQGIAAALQGGDHPFVFYNASLAIWFDLETAESIDAARKTSRRYRALAEQLHGDLHCLTFRLYEQFLMCLQGLTFSPPSFEDGVFREEACLDTFGRAGYDLGLIFFHGLKVVAAFTFGKFAEVVEHADKAWTLQLQKKRPIIQCHFATILFYHALSLIALAPQVSPERQAEFARRLEELQARLKYWADNCPENFLSRHALVAAEIARREARDLDAMKAYAQAIAAARENGFLSQESLACELAGRFYLERGFDKNAYAHLRDARAGFLRWGALAKVAQLDRQFPGIEKPAAPGATATLGAPLGQLDLANVVKASQAVSGEIEPGKLVEKLMAVVMDHAGADRGLLLLPDGDGFVVEAEAGLDRQGLAIRRPRSPLSRAQLADGVFRYVLRTRERVILEDACTQGLFTEDEYVKRHKSKSILGLPLLKQTRLLGVLYLENSLAPGVFTQNRVTALEVLASQAAISLENARLFSELEQEKGRLQAVIKSNPTPMVVIRSLDSTFVNANERFGTLLGYAAEEIYGRSAGGLGSWFMNLLDEAGKRLAAGELFRDQEFSATTRSGESKALLVSIETMMLGGDSCYLATFVDLTERKQVEEQLRQSQKMEAIGSLAGGVAHDFNNLLTAINGYSELAMMGLEASSEEYEHLRAIRSSGERAASLTRQLLAFSRKETVQTQVQSLNAIVAEMQDMLRRLIEENVEIQTCLDPEARSVNVDKGQVVQILMNLVVNARDAMPKGGRIILETRRVRLDKPTRNTLLEAAPGTYVELMVKDTGTGMTPEVMTKIFEPFFTTKEVGKGTGLGLAVVYGVVKQLGGGIALQSEPGEGSTFCIYFPEVHEGAKAEAAGREMRESYRGSETILVVEDEETVRRFIKRALTAQGYQVLECRNGVEALQLLELSEQPLDLVMTDLIMPDMGGRELATHVRAHRPNLPVLYTSGYSKEPGDSQEALAHAEHFLPKPFGPLDLARKVREVLEHASREA